MSRPVPVCNCFVLCRRVLLDPVRQDYTIVSPVHQVFSAQYPIREDLAVFARWTNAHGSYEVGVRLRTLAGEELWTLTMDEPFQTLEPLEIWILPLYRIPFDIPAPGKYEVVLLASGKVVACDTLIAHLMGPAD